MRLTRPVQIALGALVVVLALVWLLRPASEGPSPAGSSGAGDVRGEAPPPSLARSAPAPAARPEPTPSGGDVVVMDVGTLRPATGVEFDVGVDAEAASLHVRSAPGTGRIEIPEKATLPVPTDPRIRVLTRSAEEMRKEGQLWVSRLLRIHGRVSFRPSSSGDQPDPSTARVRATTLADGAHDAMTRMKAPGHWGWLQRHGLSIVEGRVDGEPWTYELTLPRSRRIGLRATAGRWAGPVVEVPSLAPDADDVVVDLEMRRFARVHGVVRDEQGAPVAGARVRVHVTQRVPSSQAPMGRPGRGWGMTVATDQAAGTSVVSHARGKTTDRDGDFDFDVDVPGDVSLLVVGPPGFQPLRHDVGPPDGDGDVAAVALEVRKSPWADRTVRFTLDGKPLSGLGIVDITDRAVQFPVDGARLDAHGAMKAWCFEPGHDYWLSTFPEHKNHFIRWRDTDVVEISDLPTNLTDFDERVR